ncbi:hypothetical protein LTR85_004423 [Meristemomyces frigidus]|nr:hypothetical protein LTR85_004423 [Meristemomyces frigidus]
MVVGRPGSSGSNWPSPSRLVRRPSNNASSVSSGPTQEEVKGGGSKQEAQAAMDPLSQHIMKRTNAPSTQPTSNRPAASDGSAQKDERATKEQSSAPAVQEPRSLARSETAENAHKELKKGVKAVSFISRLMGAKKKDAESEAIAEEAVSNEGRPEGNDASVFAQSVDNLGYSPRHLQPPAYIKVRSKNKVQRDFDRLFLAQELDCRKKRKVEVPNGGNKLRRKSSATPNASTVWAMEFSKDGKHLAAAGVDTVVRVWAVLSSSEDRQKHERQESNDSEVSGANSRAEHLSAPVFESQPVHEYEGHTATILDLSWSKNNFLLSSSMDKTVRLWHVSRSECLCTFKHNDFVPSISFHPKDDRFFLAGSLDSRLRLWSIPDKSVAYSVQLPDMITAVAFTPDGKFCVAGCLSGLCMFYETEGLKYQAQIHVRSTRGQNAKGSKITGIQTYQTSTGDIKILITSNDSRVRLYNFRDKSLELKFKGNENNCSQIRAGLSDDGRYVVCGSEDRKAYIWSLGPAEGEKRDKRPVEMFEAHDTITTAVCVAPAKTRQLLARSEDPIYDLCNPPPVTLMSRAERAESQSSSRPPTESGSIPATPVDAETKFEKPQPSPAFFARANHSDGNIIVTADYTGKIKVFRQDCAWAKRKADDGDRSSLFTKRSGRASRAGSIATRASQRSLRDGRGSTSTQAPSDRILSWRQGIASSPAIANGSQRSSSKHTSRSISPSKSVDQLGRPSTQAGSVKSTHPLSEDVTANTNGNGHHHANGKGSPDSPTSPRAGHNPQEDNPLMIEGGQSMVYWNTEHWKDSVQRMRKLHEEQGPYPLSPVRSVAEPLSRAHSGDGRLAVRPQVATGQSYVSKLSDERTSDSEDEFDDAREGGEGDMKWRFASQLEI